MSFIKPSFRGRSEAYPSGSARQTGVHTNGAQTRQSSAQPGAPQAQQAGEESSEPKTQQGKDSPDAAVPKSQPAAGNAVGTAGLQEHVSPESQYTAEVQSAAEESAETAAQPAPECPESANVSGVQKSGNCEEAADAQLNGGSGEQEAGTASPDLDSTQNAAGNPAQDMEPQPAGFPQEQPELLQEFLRRTQQMDQLVQDSQQQSERMEALIRRQIEVKDGQIDKLYTELDSYKKESAGRYEDQLLKAVIKIRISMLRMMSAEGWTGKTADEVREAFQDIFEDVTDLLELQNVVPYHTDPGQPFDKSRHQKIGSMEPTDDPALDKTVKRSRSEGYLKGDRVLVAESVILSQYQAT